MAYDVKFLAGTADGFKGITAKDAGTLYFVENVNGGYDLYKGEKLVGGVDAAGITALTARVATAEDNIGSTVKLGTSLKAQIEAEVERAKGAEKENADHIGTMTELSEGLGATLVAAINAVNTAVAAEKERAEKAEGVNAAAIATEQKRAEGIEGGLDTRLKTAEGAIETLNGKGDGSVSKAVADGIAGVIAGAPEDFDTLKEVADWIKSDTTGAAKMQSDIATLKGDKTTEGSVAHAVAAEETRATGVESGLDTRLTTAEGTIKTLEAAIGEGGSVDSQIDAKIAELDATVETAAIPTDGDGIHVKVTQTDGKLTKVEAEIEVSHAVATAKQEAIDAAATDATTKADAAKDAAATDATTKANAAEAAAKAYTDTALTWGTF